jgi:hypothetical protein
MPRNLNPEPASEEQVQDFTGQAQKLDKKERFSALFV